MADRRRRRRRPAAAGADRAASCLTTVWPSGTSCRGRRRPLRGRPPRYPSAGAGAATRAAARAAAGDDDRGRRAGDGVWRVPFLRPPRLAIAADGADGDDGGRNRRTSCRPAGRPALRPS